jgi:hypothetical protein
VDHRSAQRLENWVIHTGKHFPVFTRAKCVILGALSLFTQIDQSGAFLLVPRHTRPVLLECLGLSHLAENHKRAVSVAESGDRNELWEQKIKI